MSSVVSTYILNKFPLLQERFFVLNFIAGCPRLYLVSMPLKFLDFTFERILKLFLLGGIGSLLDFIVDTFEGLDTLSDLFITLVNLLLQFSLRHDSNRQVQTERY